MGKRQPTQQQLRRRILQLEAAASRLRQTEEALRQSEERFRLALHGSAVTVFSQDRQLRYTWVYNPTPGIKIERVLGKRDTDLYAPDDARAFIAIKRRVMATGVGSHDEVVTHRPASAGGDRVHDMTTEPLRDDKGKIVGVMCAATDITGRKRMEEELRESAMRYRTFFDHAEVGIVEATPRGKLLLVNIAAARIFGYDTPERMLTEVTDIARQHYANPQHRDVVIQALLAKGSLPSREIHFRRRDGSTGWLLVSSRLVRGRGGSTARHHAVMIEITDRKKAEAELRRQAQVIDQIHDTVVSTDLAGRIVGWNKAAERVYGYTAKEVIGRSINILYPKSQRVLLRKMVATLGRDGFHRAEVWVRTKTGDSICVDLTLSLLHDEHGTAYGMIGYSKDITERKRLEDALRESNELLFLFLKASPIYAFIKHVTPQESRVIVASENYKDMIGIPGSQMVGKKMDDLFPPGFAAKITADDWAVVSAGRMLKLEEALNGRQYTTIKFPIALGAKKLLAGYTVDITERKRLEDQLKAMNESLEAKVKERTARLRSLAAELTQAENKERRRIAHLLHEDLQQRLVAMKYKTEGLVYSGADSAAVETAKHLTEALDESIHLTRTLTSSVAPPVLYELGLRASLEWLAIDMKRQYGLNVRATGSGAIQVTSDEMQAFVFDAIRELLLNVHKHAGVRSAEIRIRGVGRKRISVAVCDRGKGLSESSERGAHFGLFSIRERAEAMGVGFTLTSRRGKGTCATLTLPAI